MLYISGGSPSVQMFHCFVLLQTLIKDPKLSSIVMNPHVKRNMKQKTFGDALTKAKLSPMIINLISKWRIASDLIMTYLLMPAYVFELCFTIATFTVAMVKAVQSYLVQNRNKIVPMLLNLYS